MTKEAEIRVMQLLIMKAKDERPPPEARKKQGKFLFRAHRESMAVLTDQFQTYSL